MEPRLRLRLYLLTALVLFGFGVLLTRLYEFQIVQQDYYKAQVPGTRQITVREPGIRRSTWRPARTACRERRPKPISSRS
jgi:penicillin-binding protein 2